MPSPAQSHSETGAFPPHFLPGILPPELPRYAFEAFDPWEYDQDTLAFGRVAWELRLLEEHRSLSAFTEVLAQLPRLGFAIGMMGTAVQIVREEARHVELCRRMVVALGGSGLIPAEPAPGSTHPSGLALPSLVRTVAGSLCAAEIFSLRLLAVVREAAEDRLAKKVLNRLAFDEAQHGDFGWTLLSLLVPLLSEEEQRGVVGELPDLLGASEQLLLDSSPEADFFAPATPNPFGFVPRRVREQIFYDTLECDVLVRFEALGLAARKAWNDR